MSMIKDIGIDLGTASVLVYVKGKGIVLNEPSVVAINTDTDMITKVGKDAQVMLGRNPENIKVVRPLERGVISQYDVTQKMIQYFIRRACGGSVIQPKVMICIPTGITEVEERAVMSAGVQAGARRTYLIENPIAAATGAGSGSNARASASAADGTGAETGSPPSDGFAGAGHIRLPTPGSVRCHNNASLFRL